MDFNKLGVVGKEFIYLFSDGAKERERKNNRKEKIKKLVLLVIGH